MKCIPLRKQQFELDRWLNGTRASRKFWLLSFCWKIICCHLNLWKQFLTILHQTVTLQSADDAIRLCQQYFSSVLSSPEKKSFFYEDRTLCKVGFSTPDMSYGWLPIKRIWLILISLLFRSSPISRGRRRLDRRQLPLCSAIPEQQLQLSLLHHTQPRPRTSMVPRTKGTSYCSRWWFVWYAAWERSGG